MLQNQPDKLIDPTTFNILTMILGAVLGGIIAPICNQIIRRLFRDKREISINSAILFLMLANAAWIIGEVTVELIDILRESADQFANIRPLAYIVNLTVYILAAYSLYIAYEHIPNKRAGERANIFELRDGPLAPFIVGNIAWIIGEAFQIFFSARSEVKNQPYFELRYYPRLVTLGYGPDT